MSAMSEFVVVVSGPNASGKSSLARALAIRLEEISGIAVAVVDLDLVYDYSIRRAGRKVTEASGRSRGGSPVAWRLRSWPKAAASWSKEIWRRTWHSASSRTNCPARSPFGS